MTLIGYGPLLPRVRDAARQHGVDRAITFIDTAGRDDFDQLFHHALSTHDLFALPCVTASNGDAEAGPPLTLVCAQATGMPVVTTRFVGSDRCILDGETAFVSAPTVSSLSAAVRAAAADPEKAHAIGLRASQLVRSRMSLSASLDDLDERYRRLLAPLRA
jgi:glycosyltransferase involved in cell wall biosynthesis